MNKKDKIRDVYHPVSVFLHWLIFLCVISAITLGFLGTEVVTNESCLGTIFKVHKTLGVSIFILTLIRIAVRVSYEMSLPAISRIENFLSRAGHMLLYVLLIIVPLSGYTMSNAHGHVVVFFGIHLPTLVDKNKELAHLLGQVHFFAAYFFLCLFIVHALMAVKHLLFDRINLFKRMSW